MKTHKMVYYYRLARNHNTLAYANIIIVIQQMQLQIISYQCQSADLQLLILDIKQQKMLKIISHNHLPVQLYKFFSQLGPLQIVLSQGQMLLRYIHIEHTYDCYMKYRRYRIDGKDLEIEKAYEWYTPQQEVERQHYEQKIKHMEDQIKKIQLINKHQALILKNKLKLLQFVQKYFGIIDNETLKKVNQIKLSYANKINCDRQLDVLQKKLRTALETTLTNFYNSVKGISNVIKSFDVKKTEIIDVEPSFEHQQVKKRQIALNTFKIDQGIQFINLQKSVIKRILALNQKQFVVSQKIQTGQVKFYRSDQEYQLQKIDFEKGPYALGCLDSVLFVGDSGGGISAICLNKDIQIDSLPKIVHNPGYVIFDIRIHAQSRTMYTAGTDNQIKVLSITQDQITDTLSEISYTSKRTFQVSDFLAAFQTVNPEVIVYASTNKLIFKNIENEMQRPNFFENKVTRIKKFNQNSIVFGDHQGFLSLYDIRIEKVVNKFPKAGINLCAIDISPPHTIFFGGSKIVGCVDDRKPNFLKWYNNKTHNDIVSDIAVLHSELISGDRSGKLISWKF